MGASPRPEAVRAATPDPLHWRRPLAAAPNAADRSPLHATTHQRSATGSLGRSHAHCHAAGGDESATRIGPRRVLGEYSGSTVCGRRCCAQAEPLNRRKHRCPRLRLELGGAERLRAIVLRPCRLPRCLRRVLGVGALRVGPIGELVGVVVHTLTPGPAAGLAVPRRSCGGVLLSTITGTLAPSPGVLWVLTDPGTLSANRPGYSEYSPIGWLPSGDISSRLASACRAPAWPCRAAFRYLWSAQASRRAPARRSPLWAHACDAAQQSIMPGCCTPVKRVAQHGRLDGPLAP